MAEINKNWFALYSKPRSEFKAEEQLNAEGIENYLPTYRTIRQWSDRKKKVTLPLLPGYIFIFATEKERLISLEQYSIVRTLTFKGVPAIIPDWQIENLRKMLDEEPEVSVVDKLHRMYSFCKRICSIYCNRPRNMQCNCRVWWCCW